MPAWTCTLKIEPYDYTGELKRENRCCKLCLRLRCTQLGLREMSEQVDSPSWQLVLDINTARLLPSGPVRGEEAAHSTA